MRNLSPAELARLTDYLAQELPPAEAHAVEQWLSERPELQRVIASLHDASRSDIERFPTDTAPLDTQVETLVRAVVPRDALPRKASSRSISLQRTFPWSPPFGARSLHVGATALLALLVMLVAIGGTWWFRTNTKTTPVHTYTYHTATGQRSTVRLQDGSTIMLAPATTIVTMGDRITVAGEAYFTIAPKASRAVDIHTRNATVKVLGTRFIVRQYPDEATSRVVVEDGRVALRALRTGGLHESHVLSSRMMAVVADSGIEVSGNVALRPYLQWTEGTLVFEGVPLHDVVTELVRVYGVEIQITDSMLAKRIVGIEVSLEKDAITQVLESLCLVADAHYERQPRGGQTYVLSPGRIATKVRPAIPPRHSFPQSELQYGK